MLLLVLDLKNLFEGSTEAIQVCYSLDLINYEIFGSYPFEFPVHVKGNARNHLSVVKLNLTAEFEFVIPCDRCLSEFAQNFKYSFSHIVVNAGEDNINDDCIVVDDFKLDLDELVLSDIILNLPSKMLCGDDCKGLCTLCGKNLNDGFCECRQF